jgi:hypothetical protein
MYYGYLRVLITYERTIYLHSLNSLVPVVPVPVPASSRGLHELSIPTNIFGREVPLVVTVFCSQILVTLLTFERVTMKISESKWKSNLEGITGILFHTYVDRQFSFSPV